MVKPIGRFVSKSIFVGLYPVEAGYGTPYVDFEATNGPPLARLPSYTVTVSLGQIVELAAVPKSFPELFAN